MKEYVSATFGAHFTHHNREARNDLRDEYRRSFRRRRAVGVAALTNLVSSNAVASFMPLVVVRSCVHSRPSYWSINVRFSPPLCLDVGKRTVSPVL